MNDITTEQAQAALEADRQRRAAECTQAIQDALRRFRCELDISVMLRAGQVMPQLQIIAQP